ncbi:hypothetical protein SPBR_08332 [Sporothrix brasiliensis 5110]|uniref:Uncharacterized protein n=1 Tax=Sporothrix brasiliensis 5110 TaxID=1398154 RepID=A0A0C2IBT5_9PEZI|nr:uncharacterized protein SPBR_08332 [Sporothrix brasiliensis 5110]KIH86736.1 hypothetical protein SPBR_08332 [Sporothrix brasiliensis 5110]
MAATHATSGAIFNVADALIRSVQSRHSTRQIPLRCEKDPVSYRRKIIAFTTMCLEGTFPAPSASLQYPTFSLNYMPDVSLGSWEPHKNPLDCARTTLSEFRDQMLSPEERRVAKPAEIRKAMQGELSDMRGIWTDVILNNFEREIVERPDDFEEKIDEEAVKEGETTKEKELYPNMSVFEESDDEEDDDEDDEVGGETVGKVTNVVEIVKLEEAVEVEMVEIKRVTQMEIVEVKKGRVKTINMNKAGAAIDNRIVKASTLPRQNSQWNSIQARLEQAADKMRQLASAKDDSVRDNVLSSRPVVLKVLKVIGSKPPPRPHWVHASVLAGVGLEQYQNCNCGSSLEQCAGCQPDEVQVPVKEVLI